MAGTVKPSGLTVARSGSTLTCSWKIASGGYADGQQFQYRIKKNSTWAGWATVSIGATVTKKSVSFNLANYYPNMNGSKLRPAFANFQFRVRGKRKKDSKASYTWSAWSVGEYNIEVPKAPSVSAELSTDHDNVTEFSWSLKTTTSERTWFTRMQWQSMLVKNCEQTDGSKLAWKSTALGYLSGAGNLADDSRNITEDTSVIAGASYTRWFRARAQGPQGSSGWKYAKHIYAQPLKASIKEASAKYNLSGGMSAKVTWMVLQSANKNPTDSVTVQYALATPLAGLTCPPGASWQSVATIKDTSDNDSASFNIDSQPGEDQCLWVRVNTKHDNNVTYGDAKLLIAGSLKKPTNVSVSVNQTNYKATINATNPSSVADSFMVVVYRRASIPGYDFPIGIIPHGSTSVTVQCPNWTDDTVGFGVYTCVGSYTAKTRADGADSYAVTAKMSSFDTVWKGGNVPLAPDEVTVSSTDIPGTIRVTWNWTWEGATAAELSWADHEDAWESTEEPSKYIVSDLYTSAWNISGLETGKTWYIRVRLISGETYGSYSNMRSIDLSSAPFKPVLSLSVPTIQEGDLFTAYWAYVSTDTTSQAYASICTATVVNDAVVYGDEIAHVQTAQHVNITAPSEWQTGETYLLCLKVTSESGHESEWSDPVAVSVAEPLVCDITQTSLQTVTVSSDDEEETTREVLALTAMPLTLTVTGAGIGGTTTVIVERAADYHADRPDETQINGFEGETIAVFSQLGEFEISLDEDVLVGMFDDGAQYRLIATVQDGLGQSDSQTIEFEVHWTHQAVIPNATAVVDGSVVKITPIKPSGAIASDICDIYRLSADRPVLIVQNGEFGTTYVDPYPAIDGGHRVVLKTTNGDYITADDSFAWVDVEDGFTADYNIIDFNGEQLILRYNLALSNAWRKDFTETAYLGGSIQGDWNPAVRRTLSASSVSVTSVDPETIEGLRRLAVYPGICHVRTVDGSSFDADIQVSESRSYQSGKKVDFDLSITRIDPEGLDGMTLEEWEDGLE